MFNTQAVIWDISKCMSFCFMGLGMGEVSTVIDIVSVLYER